MAFADDLLLFQQHMVSYGQSHATTEEAWFAQYKPGTDAGTGIVDTYYDAGRCFFQIYDFLGTVGQPNAWAMQAALNAVKIYRDTYLMPNQGKLPGYEVFPHGLYQDFLRTSDPLSKTALLLLYTNSAYANPITPLAWTQSADHSREVAYQIHTKLIAELLGQPHEPRLDSFLAQAKNHLDQFFLLEAQSNGAPNVVRPFMVGITMAALIEAEDKYPDPATIQRIAFACETMWSKWFDTTHNAFWYTNIDTAKLLPNQEYYNTGGTNPAPDVNLLVGPAYWWLFSKTGNTKYRDQGDAIFNGGVRGAYLAGTGKQFNQNYRWSLPPYGLTWRGSLV